MSTFYPQSKGSWFSREFQAACVESYRAVVEGRYTRLDAQRHVENVARFAAESSERGFPSWEQIRKWVKEFPNLPEEVRKKDFLGDFKPLQPEMQGIINLVPLKNTGSGHNYNTVVYPEHALAYQTYVDIEWYAFMRQIFMMIGFALIFSFFSSLLESSAT
jgi:hypothetical protein